MAKYGKTAQKKVKKAMHERKKGTPRAEGSGKKVTSKNRRSRLDCQRRGRPAAKCRRRRAVRRNHRRSNKEGQKAKGKRQKVGGRSQEADGRKGTVIYFDP
jgi:hypothetical protein